MFYVYNNYILDGIIMQFQSVEWVRSYQETGAFTMAMPFDREYFQMLKEDTLVYNKAAHEWGMVTGKSVTADSFGNMIFIVTGKGLGCLLARRIAKYNATAKISTIVIALLNQNFIAPQDTKRKISNFTLGDVSIADDKTIAVDFDYTDVEKLISDLAKAYGFGYRVRYDIPTAKFVFEVYEGENKPLVVFSEDYNNVSEQEYFLDVEEYKNTCYVKTDETITVVNGTNTGLSRYEAFTTGTAGEDSGTMHLAECRRVENLETVINTASPQFLYLQDWNLGDRVTTKNKMLGVMMQKHIAVIEEFYDEMGLNLTVQLEE